MNLFRIKFILFITLGITLTLHACNRGGKQAKEPAPGDFKEPLINANQKYVQLEQDEIAAYVKRKGWEMQKTGSGLRYMILEKGNGEAAQNGMRAKVNYKVYLTNGTICYSSDQDGPREFMIGQDNVERGLHEGILFLHQGDKALFVLPSYLAHGLTGDANKIPSKATVIYEIELLSLR